MREAAPSPGTAPSRGTAARARRGVVLRGFAFALVCGLAGLLVLGVSLSHRGQEAMDRSDEAFHQGDLRAAVDFAKRAGLAYLPGADHVRRAERRLEAIGRGAEAEGNFELARRAWDALRIVDEQTTYPGRGEAAGGRRARQALERLERQKSEEAGQVEVE